MFLGVLCMDRNGYCKNLAPMKCESDTWMKENCAGTCKTNTCDKVIYRPAGRPTPSLKFQLFCSLDNKTMNALINGNMI